MVRLSLPYTSFKKDVDFLLSKQKTWHILYWRISFYIHVFVSSIVLLAGFTQFSRYIIRRAPLWHRRLGIVYVTTVLVFSAPTGFIMGLHANGGLPAKTSFVLLSISWFVATLLALYYAKQKAFVIHGDWMLRSYALTLSAIALRLYALLFDVLHINMQPRQVYITIAWLSWIPNLVVAEILIRRGFTKKVIAGTSTTAEIPAAPQQ